MPLVVVTDTAKKDLADLIEEHSLPRDTKDRIKERLRPLGRFPSMGSPLAGRWEGSRFLLGPWKWMLLVYEYLEDLDIVAVTTIQDARKADSATTRSYR